MEKDYKSIDGEIQKLINTYNLLIKGIDKKAKVSEERAYGGIIRADKGKLVENIAKRIVEISWDLLGEPSHRLLINRQTIRVPLKKDYIEKIKIPEVKQYISENIHTYYYPLSADLHIHIDNRFVIAIECKAYTENAMLKRILVDSTLLKHIYPDLEFILFQLESQLGGDYSHLDNVTFGSPSTHTLLSYFDIDLHIITILKGERKVDRPIHKPDYYKPLTKEGLYKAIEVIQEVLMKHR
jgi:hypothetical protein